MKEIAMKLKNGVLAVKKDHATNNAKAQCCKPGPCSPKN